MSEVPTADAETEAVLPLPSRGWGWVGWCLDARADGADGADGAADGVAKDGDHPLGVAAVGGAPWAVRKDK